MRWHQRSQSHLLVGDGSKSLISSALGATTRVSLAFHLLFACWLTMTLTLTAAAAAATIASSSRDKNKDNNVLLHHHHQHHHGSIFDHGGTNSHDDDDHRIRGGATSPFTPSSADDDDDDDGSSWLAILALPSGVLFETHLAQDPTATSDAGAGATPSRRIVATNNGNFLFGKYGQRAFPTTTVSIPTTASPSRSGPLPGTLPLLCQAVSSLRFYSPTTAFMFPIPLSQQQQKLPQSQRFLNSQDKGGPLALVNGTCEDSRATRSNTAINNSIGADPSMVTAIAPVVVSLRDPPGRLPDALAGAVLDVVSNVQNALKYTAWLSACSVLSQQRWWPIHDLSALRAAMPTPTQRNANDTASAGHGESPLTLVAAYAQATADGDASDGNNASFPVDAYGYTCIARADSVVPQQKGGRSKTKSFAVAERCGPLAVAMPVYHLRGLVLAYAFKNDSTNTSGINLQNQPNVTIRVATVFIGGMPFTTTARPPVAPVNFNGLGIFNEGTAGTALSFGFSMLNASRVPLPSAAYSDPNTPMLLSQSATTRHSTSKRPRCPQTMANNSTPRWADTIAATLPPAGSYVSCAGFVGPGGYVGLTNVPIPLENEVQIHESDYILLAILPPPTTSSPSLKAPGSWLFPADVVLVVTRTFLWLKVTFLHPTTSLSMLPQTTAVNVNKVQQWDQNDAGASLHFPAVCPWLALGEDYNKRRELCLLGTTTRTRGGGGGETASCCLGPGTLRTIAVSFNPSAPITNGEDAAAGNVGSSSSSGNNGPVITALPAGECVLFGQLLALLPFGQAFLTPSCPAMVAPPLPRDYVGFAAVNLRQTLQGQPLHSSCLDLPQSIPQPAVTTSVVAANNSSSPPSLCPRWASPFPLVGDTSSSDYQGPPPADQTAFLTNEEAWCAFNQYLAAAPTMPTMGVAFLCSTDRKTVFVVTCGGDRFSTDGDVDFDAPSQSPPAAGPSWSALWASWVQGDDAATNQTRPPYYASLGGVPLMAFDAINDPSGFRFHCSACTLFIEAGEGPLPYAAVALAALKDALLVALGVWIMSVKCLQHGVVAAVAWLSSLVVPFRDPAISRRLKRTVAEALRTCDEITPTQLGQNVRALVAFGTSVAPPDVTVNEGDRREWGRFCVREPESVPLSSTSNSFSGPQDPKQDLFVTRSFEAFLMYFVLRGCQKNVDIGLLTQWMAEGSTDEMLPETAHSGAAKRFAALEVAHCLCALRAVWERFVCINTHQINEILNTPISDANNRVDKCDFVDCFHVAAPNSLGGQIPSKPCAVPLLESWLQEQEKKGKAVAVPTVTGEKKDPLRKGVSDKEGKNTFDHDSVCDPGNEEEGEEEEEARWDLDQCQGALGAATRALWEVLDGHNLLVPVTFFDTAIDHHITPPAWLLLIHLLFCFVFMVVILVTVARAHGQPCENMAPSDNGHISSSCVLSSRWATYQAIFFRYVNSTAAVSFIVNAVIRVLYLPPLPPDLGNDHKRYKNNRRKAFNGSKCSSFSPLGSLDCTLVLQAGRAAAVAAYTPATTNSMRSGSPSAEEEVPQAATCHPSTTTFEEDLLSQTKITELPPCGDTRRQDETMVAVLRRGNCVDMFTSTRSLVGRCLTDRFVQCGLLLPLPVLLTHAVVGFVLYAWVTIPVIALLGLVAVIVSSTTNGCCCRHRQHADKSNTGQASVKNDTPPDGVLDESSADDGIPQHPSRFSSAPTRSGHRRKPSVLCVVTARLAVRVLITFACVLLCQTTVNWMVLAYTGGGGNWRLAYTFEAPNGDFNRQAQSGNERVPNTFLFRHRFPPPPNPLVGSSRATAGTAAAVERLQDMQYVSYSGVLVREFEARSFACTLEMLTATFDGSMQTLSVLF